MRNPADDRDEEPRGVAERGGAGDEPRAGALAERRWSVVAGVCVVAAAALWVFVGVDAAFVVATFGVLAWFWDQRNRIERRSIESGGGQRAADDEDEEFADEFEDDFEGETGNETVQGDEIEDDDAKPKAVKR